MLFRRDSSSIVCSDFLRVPVIVSFETFRESQKLNLDSSDVRYFIILLPVLVRAFILNSEPVPVRYRAGFAVPR